MNIQQRKISEIKPSPTNANKHDEKQIAAIADSIITYGWTKPILITQDDYIVAGHGAYFASKRLGIEEIPVIVVGSNWSTSQLRAYMLADNALNRRSSWDLELLALELHELHEAGYDMNLTGFTVEDLSSYMGYEEQIAPPDDAEPHEPHKKVCPECGHEW